MAFRIDSIIQRTRATYIRSGKVMLEIPGGIEELRAWADSTPGGEWAVAALAVKEHLLVDPALADPRAIVNKDLTVTVGRS